MNTSREGFGPSLRRERERRGITLDAIADSTKIKRSLLQGLERNDLSQWPLGIFRRAFVRAYASAIGVPAEPLVAEFVHLFPEPGEQDTADGEAEPVALRLLMAEDPRRISPRARNALAAAADAALVLAAGLGLSMVVATTRWSAVGLVAVVYYTVSTICCGRTLAVWLWNRPSGTPLLHPSRWSVRTGSLASLYHAAADTQAGTEVHPAGRLLGS
jgi:transcriptional regulator with XRE-family HTH domain